MHIITPETAIAFANVALPLVILIAIIRAALDENNRHRLLNVATHYLNDSHSEFAHRVYRYIHRKLPPFDRSDKGHSDHVSC